MPNKYTSRTSGDTAADCLMQFGADVTPTTRDNISSFVGRTASSLAVPNGTFMNIKGIHPRPTKNDLGIIERPAGALPYILGPMAEVSGVTRAKIERRTLRDILGGINSNHPTVLRPVDLVIDWVEFSINRETGLTTKQGKEQVAGSVRGYLSSDSVQSMAKQCMLVRRSLGYPEKGGYLPYVSTIELAHFMVDATLADDNDTKIAIEEMAEPLAGTLLFTAVDRHYYS